MTMNLADVLRHVLPDGTRVETAQSLTLTSARPPSDWEKAPNFPPDLFAVTAYLLDHAGAYSYIIPEFAGAFAEACYTRVTRDEICAWKTAAKEIKVAVDFPEVLPAVVNELWKVIWTGAFERNVLVYAPLAHHVAPPDWWKAAYGLLVIADEACVDVGYDGHMGDKGDDRLSWIAKYVKASSMAIVSKNNDRKGKPEDVRMEFKHVTISPLTDHSVLCVQPKARTPRVGCTMRSLSHNLALLPPAGFVTTDWQRPPATPPDEDGSNLNLLLVPLPYTIHPSWFDVGEDAKTETGWFDLNPRWLSEATKILGVHA